MQKNINCRLSRVSVDMLHNCCTLIRTYILSSMRNSCLASHVYFEATERNLDVATLVATVCFATLSKLSLFETLLRVRVAKILDTVTYTRGANGLTLNSDDSPRISPIKGTELLNLDTIVYLRDLLRKLTKTMSGIRLSL